MAADIKYDYNSKTATLHWPEKTKVYYQARTAPGGFIFYEIACSDARLPKELAGNYTSLEKP